MKRKPAHDDNDVEAYLATVSADSRKALERIRGWIRAAAPEAEEGFSYGVPAFKLDGKPLVCFAAFKNHCGFYPMSPDVLRAFAADLADYDTAKGTIRFQPKKPLPAALVKKIVKARLAELKK
jgi:uncharacterized protein YdhG (YjbR/CyaY superfamily)